MAKAKRQSLFIFTWVALSMFAAGWLIHSKIEMPYVGTNGWGAVALISMGVGFFFAGRIRCPNCGFLLSEKHRNTGVLIFLWLFFWEKCPRCGNNL
jgi:hypothetical protein